MANTNKEVCCPILSTATIRQRIIDALAGITSLRRVLLVHPDYSRNDFSDLIAPILYQILDYKGLERLDTLNAPGTHRPMRREEILHKLGFFQGVYPKLGEHYNHQFDNPSNLVSVGVIDKDFIANKTNGYVTTALDMRVNKCLVDPRYDAVIAINGIVPHEGTGYSGGTKIFFPGLAAPDAIGLFHWSAVLMGVPSIIGQVENPARDIVNEGARLIFERIGSKPVVSLSMVYTEDSSHQVEPRGFFVAEGFGGFQRCLEEAALLSSKLHVEYVDEPMDIVVQQIPEMYDEVWTAGKGSYKLQKPGVLAPGAEIILYAPHIKHFHSNAEMDKRIKEIGYHGRDYVINFLCSHPDFDRNVAAHVINVRGVGMYDGKKEHFPFKVTLATQIPPDQCVAVGLGYRDPSTLRSAEFKSGKKLWIAQGGQWLYARR